MQLVKSQGPFVATLSLIVLAPVFVAAGNYLLIGRLIRAVLPANSQRVFGIHGRLLTRIFVLCDVISFLVQCAGSAVASSEDWQGPTGETGVHILIGGLAFQVLTFCSFMVIFARFHVLALQRSVVDAPVGWRKVVTAVYLSSTMILVSETCWLRGDLA